MRIRAHIVVLLACLSAWPLAAEEPRRQVVIIGGGLAGLVSAYELERAGYDVLVLEGQQRPGGRILTVRTPFSGGLYAEAGATRIPDQHHLTLHYVNLFGLPLSPVGFTVPRYHLLAPPPTEAMTEAERALGISGLEARYVTPLRRQFQQLGNLRTSAQARSWDSISMEEYLREQGLSPAAIRALLTVSGDGLSGAVSVLSWLIEYNIHRVHRRVFMIDGGNDRLPLAFSNALGERIRFGARVTRVHQNGNEVRVSYVDSSGAEHAVVAERVIVTAPGSTLDRIDFHPAFEPQRQYARSLIQYERVARVFIQIADAFWHRGENPLPVATTDLPSARVWDITAGQPGRGRILVSYTMAEDAERMGAMSEAERWVAIRRDLERTYPGLRLRVQGGHTELWHQNPWAMGAYVSTSPYEMTELIPAAGAALGRVLFAGDEYSSTTGWMQGAIESALQTVVRVIREERTSRLGARSETCAETLENLLESR